MQEGSSTLKTLGSPISINRRKKTAAAAEALEDMEPKKSKRNNRKPPLSMKITAVAEAEEDIKKQPKKRTRRKGCNNMENNNEFQTKKRKGLPKGISLAAVCKPSYNLKCRGGGGNGNNITTDFKSLRFLHRNKLIQVLQKLVRRHNWIEASGVLSVLLKTTSGDKSQSRIHIIYRAALEVLKHTDCRSSNHKKFKLLFETWMTKLWKPKDPETKGIYMVQLEYIIYCLCHKKTEDAYQAAIGLMQDCGFRASPISNLVIGLTICQKWYDALCEEFPALSLSGFRASNQGEMSEPALDMSIKNFGRHVANEFQEYNYTVPCNSDTSVRNNKDIGCDDVIQHQEVSMNVDLHRKTPHRWTQSFYISDSESDGHEELPYSVDGSIFYAQGLEPWLLPSRLLHTFGSIDEFLRFQKKVHNDAYKNALKYLRLALNSTPPMPEALLPLVQMLLLGDQVKEAVNEVEKFSGSDTAHFIRLKASLWEYFGNNLDYLSTYFEDALKKDPTCTHSLTKLLSMHHKGYYRVEKLLEMVALHLDATFAECNMWKEFASCFLKLSPSEEDRISTFCAGNNDIWQGQSNNCNRNPSIFADGVMGKQWRLRCKWWMTRHFSRSILVSELEAGNVQLLTYKAASACHLYGQEFDYVKKIFDFLKKDTSNSDMISFLQRHMKNSVGIYHNFKRV